MPTEPLTDALEETLAVFEGDGEPLTTTGVADSLDLGRRSTYERLERLVERDRLRTKKVGANARVWWRPPEAESGDGAVTDETAAPDETTATDETTAPDGAATAGVAVDDGERLGPAGVADRTVFGAMLDAVEEYALCTLDADGTVATWNAGAERITGYDAGDVLGEHVSTFYTESDRETGVPERVLADAAERGSVEESGWRVRADGSRFWAAGVHTAIRDDGGRLRGYATVVRDMTDRREYERELRGERDVTRRVLETAPADIFVVDAHGDVVRTNDRVEDVFDLEGDAESFTIEDADVYDESGAFVPPDQRPFRTVFESGEAVTDWVCQVELPSGERRWRSINVAPIPAGDGDRTGSGEGDPADRTASANRADAEGWGDGSVDRVVVATQDISRLKRQERRLERRRDELEHELEAVFDRVDDAFYALDEGFRFTYVNDRAAALLGHDEAALLGRTVWAALDVPDDDPIRERFETAMATQQSTTFERESGPLGIWEDVRIYPSESGLSVYFTDVSERKERERELERYETVVETLWDGVYALDPEENYVMANDAFLDMTGYDREELLGRPGKVVHDEAINEAATRAAERVDRGEQAFATLEFDLRTKRGEPVRVESRFGPYPFDDDRSGRTGVVRDVTDRKERERELEESRRRLRTLVEHFPNGAVGLVDESDGTLRYRTVGGTPIDETGAMAAELEGRPVAEALPPAVAAVLVPRYEAALAGEASTVEATFGDRTYQVHTVPVSDDDGDVFAALGMSQDVTERTEMERTLRDAKSQLEALDTLNEVVRGITSAIVDQSTREEIEATVCERLAETDSYVFAWIGDADPRTGTVNSRAEAGADGYLDDVTISVDPDDERSEGPTGRALRTGAMQVSNDVEADSTHDPWRDAVDSHGVRSSAAIPIVHQGTVYGALNVYADRPYAFVDQEREVVRQLGEVVGHAIAAAERRQALVSDELLELEFGIPEFGDRADRPTDASGPITFDHVVEVAEDEFLAYGSGPPDAPETLRALVDALPHWSAVTFHGADAPRRTDAAVPDEAVSFEVRLVDPPFLSIVVARGGYLDRATLEDGDLRLTIHLAPSVDVRQVIDAVEAAYPQADLHRRRQFDRPRDDRDRVQRHLATDLTDRQSAALEAAYHAGFFEWPRVSDGEDVAESLDVAPSTFHQHLRKAERKVFDALLSTAAEDGPT